MKRVLITAPVLATLLALSTLAGPAMADSHDRGRGQQERHDSDRRGYQRHDGRHDSRDNRHDDRRYDSRPDRYSYDHNRYYNNHHERYRVARYYGPRGYRPYAWHSGARLPRAYYAPRYVVHDYGAYRLRTPPRGYHWVRVDHDVVLAAIATGVVLQVVDGLFY